MHELPSVIYKYKSEIIRLAIVNGYATNRLIAVERPCKTCKGSGTYEWRDWNDEDHVEYQCCRRCAATGKVILRFVETAISSVKFHTPRPKCCKEWFSEAEWESATLQTDWEPEQPGRALERLELFQYLNAIENFVFGDRIIPHDHWDREVTPYHLDLGVIPQCWVCGSIVESSWSIDSTYWGSRVHRPGISWRADLCHQCRADSKWAVMPYQWPRNLDHCQFEHRFYPQWCERCLLPDLAFHPTVVEWLARRGIVYSAFPPGDYCLTPCGWFVRVHHAKGDSTFVIADSQDNLLYGDDRLIELPSRDLYRGRNGSWCHRQIPVEI